MVSTATYDAGNRLATWGGQIFSYDANGNLASDGPTSYLWNARNQLVGLSGSMSATFAYDGLGRRRTKAIGGTTTSFLYDDLNFIQEQASGGTPTVNLLTGLALDETFVRTDANGSSTQLVDVLASTLALADTTGTLQTQYTYEPFGATMTSGAASTNAVQFTGRENDSSGLYYFRARYLSTPTRRFLSEDPAEFAGNNSFNLYPYADNNPLALIDPLGLSNCAPPCDEQLRDILDVARSHLINPATE